MLSHARSIHDSYINMIWSDVSVRHSNVTDLNEFKLKDFNGCKIFRGGEGRLNLFVKNGIRRANLCGL